MSSLTNHARADRRPDIDWLRVLAVLLLVPFHTARIFDVWDPFYAKNAELSLPLSYLVAFLNPWHMPLLFVLAGMSTWFALRRRSGGQYLGERLRRLLVPLLFGVLVVVPPQAYYGLLTHSAYGGSYLEFWPSFFVVHPEDMSGYYGTFTPGHLWFILFLFAFSLAALPLFLRWRTGRPEVAALARVGEPAGAIFLLALPLAVTDAMPDLGGKVAPFYFLLFVYGYLLVASPRLQQAIDRHAWWAFGLGLVTMTASLLATAAAFHPAPGSVGALLLHGLRAFNGWLWVVAALGLGRRYLSTSSRFLRYASEASYPFYILHQTVIVIVGFYVVQWDAPVAIKYGVILAAATLGTVALYEVMVRRVGLLRVLFGLKLDRGVGRPGPARRLDAAARPFLG
jgi:glucans biosynthesis protein C